MPAVSSDRVESPPPPAPSPVSDTAVSPAGAPVPSGATAPPGAAPPPRAAARAAPVGVAQPADAAPLDPPHGGPGPVHDPGHLVARQRCRPADARAQAQDALGERRDGVEAGGELLDRARERALTLRRADPEAHALHHGGGLRGRRPVPRAASDGVGGARRRRSGAGLGGRARGGAARSVRRSAGRPAARRRRRAGREEAERDEGAEPVTGVRPVGTCGATFGSCTCGNGTVGARVGTGTEGSRTVGTGTGIGTTVGMGTTVGRGTTVGIGGSCADASPAANAKVVVTVRRARARVFMASSDLCIPRPRKTPNWSKG